MRPVTAELFDRDGKAHDVVTGEYFIAPGDQLPVWLTRGITVTVSGTGRIVVDYGSNGDHR